MVAAQQGRNFKIASENRRARFDYEIGEIFEAGLMLTGTEVKSLRTGKATIAESYASRRSQRRGLSHQRDDPGISAGQSVQSRAENGRASFC